MHEIDVSDDSSGLLVIDSSVHGDDLEFYIYNYHNQDIKIDVSDAQDHDILIERLKIFTANSSNIEFIAKPKQIKVQHLIFCSVGVNYLGGAEVADLEIYTEQELISLAPNIANKISIEQIEDIDNTQGAIKNLMAGFNILPGTGEYILNSHDSIERVKDIKSIYPNCNWISPIVSWFADSTNIENCRLRPGIDRYGQKIDDWQVAEFTKHNAYKISLINDGVNEHTNYGSSVDDRSLVGFLKGALGMGFKILFYPIIMVDQKDKPWRGHITGNANFVEDFYLLQYRAFILHYANLVKGLVDGFIIGSELIGLTKIKIKNSQTSTYEFPFIKKLIALSSDVRLILGGEVKITYAADWSEYHTTDGCLRPLDELWMYKDIDFVGIDAYFPLTDSKKSNISIEEIKQGWHSGHGYDYYYDGTQQRSFNNEHWNAWKNLRYWWENEHYEYDIETKLSRKTNWIPKSKPIWFTEFGFPSINKSSNQPNIFFDYQSKDAGVPRYSNGKIDFAIQRRALKATLEVWKDSDFVENMFCWGFDIRQKAWHRNSYYADHRLWDYGHWVDGKIWPICGLRIFGKITANSLSIKALKDCEIHPMKIQIKEFLKISSNGDLKLSSIMNTYKAAESESQTQDLEIVFIKAKQVYLQVKGDCIFESANIITQNIDISSCNLVFQASVTTDIDISSYQDKILSGLIKSKKYFKKETIEKAHVVTILSESGNFEVEKLFTAQGSKIMMNSLQIVSTNYDFSGIKLLSESFEKTSSRILFSSDYNSTHKAIKTIQGAEFLIQGKCYLIAKSIIWMKASKVDAIDLTVKAKEVKLEGLACYFAQESVHSKSGIRLCWDFRPGHYLVGAELYKFKEKSKKYIEYLCPSILSSRTLIIETENLEQNGAIIQGQDGNIAAKDWSAEEVELKQDFSRSSYEVSLGARVAIKENITPVIAGALKTTDAINSPISNPYYGPNLASSLYKNFRNITSLGSNLIISADLGLHLKGSFNQSEFHHKEYYGGIVLVKTLKINVENTIQGALQFNNAQFNNAQLDKISGASAIKIPKSSKTNSWGHSNSFGINLLEQDFSFSHSSQENNNSYGASYSGNLNNSDNNLFGNEISLTYQDENSQLDVSFAKANLEKIAQVWRSGRNDTAKQLPAVASKQLPIMLELDKEIQDENQALQLSRARKKKQPQERETSLAANDNVALDHQHKRAVLFAERKKAPGKESSQESYNFVLLLLQKQEPQQETHQEKQSNARALFSLLPQAHSKAPALPHASALAPRFAPTLAPIFDLSGVPILEALSLRAAHVAARSLAATSLTTLGAGVLHNTAKFQADHIWLGDDFTRMLDNPLIPQHLKDAWIEQMQQDPLLQSQDPAAGSTALQPLAWRQNPEINIPGSIAYDEAITQTYNLDKIAGRILKDQNKAHTNPHMWHDPEAGKPKTLSTPIYDNKGHLEIFPEHSDLFKLLGPQGFDPIGSEHIFTLPGFDLHETSWHDLILFKKQYPDTVEKINDRYPINAQYAGQKYPMEKLMEKLSQNDDLSRLSEDVRSKLLKDGVSFDEKGFVRLEPYAESSIYSEELTGRRDQDRKIANRLSGIITEPEGYVWHHIEDSKTMLLVPEILHKSVHHTGGAAILKGKKK